MWKDTDCIDLCLLPTAVGIVLEDKAISSAYRENVKIMYAYEIC